MHAQRHAREGGAGALAGVVADRDDEVERRCLRPQELVPGFRPHLGDVVAEIRQEAQGQRMRGLLRARAGREGLDPPQSLAVEHRLGHDRTGRVAGADHQDTQGPLARHGVAARRKDGRRIRTGQGAFSAAGLGQEGLERIGARGLGGEDDVAAVAPRRQQPDLLERGQMRGQRVVRDRPPGHAAGSASAAGRSRAASAAPAPPAGRRRPSCRASAWAVLRWAVWASSGVFPRC